MDCRNINEYKEEGILSPILYTAHLYFLVIHPYSIFTLSYETILQAYCLDSVSSGCLFICANAVLKIITTSSEQRDGCSFYLNACSLFCRLRQPMSRYEMQNRRALARRCSSGWLACLLACIKFKFGRRKSEKKEWKLKNMFLLFIISFLLLLLLLLLIKRVSFLPG